jgi:tetratricopeptide (TPR) repeat protein
MKRTIAAFLSIVCLVSCAPNAAERQRSAQEYLDSAQALVNSALCVARHEEAGKGTGRLDTVSYEKALAPLTRLASGYPEERDVLAKVQRLRVLCCDRLARYDDKHRALRHNADLTTGGDTNKAARLVMTAADRLLDGGEVGEAVLLYRSVIAVYPGTRSAGRAYLKIAAILALEYDREGAIAEYRKLVRRFPNGKEAELVAFRLVDMNVAQTEVF